jgi:hypothetical protein
MASLLYRVPFTATPSSTSRLSRVRGRRALTKRWDIACFEQNTQRSLTKRFFNIFSFVGNSAKLLPSTNNMNLSSLSPRCLSLPLYSALYSPILIASLATISLFLLLLYRFSLKDSRAPKGEPSNSIYLLRFSLFISISHVHQLQGAESPPNLRCLLRAKCQCHRQISQSLDLRTMETPTVSRRNHTTSPPATHYRYGYLFLVLARHRDRHVEERGLPFCVGRKNRVTRVRASWDVHQMALQYCCPEWETNLPQPWAGD